MRQETQQSACASLREIVRTQKVPIAKDPFAREEWKRLMREGEREIAGVYYYFQSMSLASERNRRETKAKRKAKPT